MPGLVSVTLTVHVVAESTATEDGAQETVVDVDLVVTVSMKGVGVAAGWSVSPRKEALIESLPSVPWFGV